MKKNDLKIIGPLLLFCAFLTPCHPLAAQKADSGKKPVPATNSKNLKLIVGDTAEKEYLPRIKAVEKLGGDLSPAEISTIFQFLHKKSASEKMELLEFNALKNELVRVLMRQEPPPPAMVEQLADMYQDKSFDDVWRDYCIQFIGQLYPKIKIPATRELAIKTMTAGLKDSKGGIAGTSLIALSRLEGSEINKEKISAQAEAFLADKNVPDIVKIPALQVGANLGNRNILKFAKEILDNSPNIPLKVSAVAAIGILKDTSETPRLKEYLKASDIRLRAAAEGALKRMQK